MSDPADLVTLEQVQTAYPHLDNDQVADLPALITAASVEIAERHPDLAPVQLRIETWDPGYDRDHALKWKPVQNIIRIRVDMTRVVYLSYIGPARRALAFVNDVGTGVNRVCNNLSLVEEQNGVTTTVATFGFATYPTIGQLAGAINAAPGWTATSYSGQEDMACTDLEPNQGPFAVKSGDPTQAESTAWLFGYVRDLNTYWLSPDNIIHLYEWRMPSYRYPKQQWGIDPTTTTVKGYYNAGQVVTRADVARGAIIVIGDLLESTEYAGPVTSARSEDAAWTISAEKYHFPPAAERIFSRYRRRIIA